MHAMTDPTELTRQGLVAELNSKAADRTVLEAHYGKVWGTTELAIEFEVSAFAAPYVIVKQKSDNKVGSHVSASSSLLFRLRGRQSLSSSGLIS